MRRNGGDSLGGDESTPTWWSRFLSRLRQRYRLVLSTADTYQEVWGVRLTRLNILVALGVLFLVLLLLSWLLVAFTPIRRLLPGTIESTVNRQYVVENALRADSLSREVDLWGNYLANLRVIFSGGSPEPYLTDADSALSVQNMDSVGRSVEDSLLRESVERELQGGRMESGSSSVRPVVYRRPVEGDVINRINEAQGHYGVDIVGAPESAIVAVDDGVVVMAQWTSDFGYVIGVQHAGGLLSIYKHNTKLLRKVNDKVRAGDALAVIGGSGKTSTGLHLHLEFWRNGQLEDPLRYLNY